MQCQPIHQRKSVSVHDMKHTTDDVQKDAQLTCYASSN